MLETETDMNKLLRAQGEVAMLRRIHSLPGELNIRIHEFEQQEQVEKEQQDVRSRNQKRDTLRSSNIAAQW